jgi:hypothetical protein
MARRSLVTLAAALALAALAVPARAQEPPRPEAAPKPPETPKASDERPAGGMPGSTVRVSLVIARYQGEKKIASLPYTLVVGTGGARTRMRMGVDTPIPVTQYVANTEKDGPKPSTSFQYRNVGTNIDCAVWERGRMSEAGQRETVYRVSLSVENSSAFSGPDARTAGGGVEGAPLFRRFETTIDVGMRDGQTVQTIASTDPVTGEVVKIDVTLNVVK